MTGITWYKRFFGSVLDPEFSAAAIEAQSDHCHAWAVWAALLETTRGHEEDIATIDLLRAVAVGLHLPLDEVERVFEAFVSRGMLAGIRDPQQPATSITALSVDLLPTTDFRGEVSRYLTAGRGK